ncbi:hypothetical protein Xmau_00148 [Xenorhabdus mauleonii]|uniref:Uncharacterized protein n=1 Tax=Xenorhabdus mauleonii TaxID=351675 RepID=A0A1I3N7X9_9GAMM|nr:hypothetical protein [Xenorhabdus mauleonii]PHM45760.1 hypothetical protein Xmau_00148 [Xenorhabdus mauleonii]SFJ05150.1 hypothetical protein SAMN05421680_105112 [Xenorhabdus mauleonii]
MTLKLVAVYPDAYVFVEPDPKERDKKRLTISCHGEKTGVMINGTYFGALGVAQLIRGWAASIANLHSVRMIICGSADPGSSMTIKPLAMELSAQLRDILIKGYVRKVAANCAFPTVYDCFCTYGRQAVEYGLSCFSISKDDPLYHFHSVVFLNGVQVKQTMNGHDFVTLGYDGKARPFGLYK